MPETEEPAGTGDGAPIVIVGGGLAAIRTTQALRGESYEGPIVLLSEEDEAPYDRPPLSKKFLLGTATDDDIRLLAEDKLAELDVDVRLGASVTGIDREAHHVLLEGGEQVAYAKLVIATGAGPARLGFVAGDNVHVLRTAGDARDLRAQLGEGVRLGIVGGGFIGLEIAAVGLELGCEVTVIEAASAPLAPVLGDELGAVVQRWHESKGVGFACGSPLQAAHGEGSVTELELADGTRLAVDVVVVGVGVRRNTGFLEDSGLELTDGLVCDDLGRTDDPDVFGVGDVVVVRTAAGEHHPTGHWTATTEQARRVAKAATGTTDQPEVVHDFYFWSDQHDLRMQFLGTVPDEPRLHYIAGEPGDEKFVVLISDGEHVSGVFGVGIPRDFIKATVPLRQGEKVPAPTA